MRSLLAACRNSVGRTAACLIHVRLPVVCCAVRAQALEPIFRNMMEAAMQNAASHGRDSITEADLEVVRKRIKQR